MLFLNSLSDVFCSAEHENVSYISGMSRISIEVEKTIFFNVNDLVQDIIKYCIQKNSILFLIS